MYKKPSTIIRESENYLSVDDNRIKLNDFLYYFSCCEVYCRSALNKYHKDDGVDLKKIGLCAKDIRDAFSEEGIYFEDEKLIYLIFGAEDRVGKSSCRWLRNKVTHELMKRAMHEICDRHDELIGYMKEFVDKVEEQT